MPTKGRTIHEIKSNNDRIPFNNTIRSLLSSRSKRNIQNREEIFSEIKVEVIIADVNDNPPLTSRSLYEVNIDENNPPDIVLFRMSAWDPDSGNNGLVSYALELQRPNSNSYKKSEKGDRGDEEDEDDSLTISRNERVLSIDKESGEIASHISFDFESTETYIALVFICDHGNPSLTTTVHFRVKVQDLNDNPPHFNKSIFYMSISENERGPPGNVDMTSLVGHVIATDADTLPEHRRVVYAIEDGVGNNSSIITNNEPYTLENVYKHLKVNSSSSYNGNLSNKKYFDVPSFWFSIDHDTGLIRTKRPLDREFQSSFYFNVSATHPTFPIHISTAQVVVYVNDVNDNRPHVIKPKQREIIQRACPLVAGNNLFRVEAIDPDEGLNGQAGLRFELISVAEVTVNDDHPTTNLHTWKNYSEIFLADRLTGLVVVSDLLLHKTPSHEFCLTYKLKVRVSDGGENPGIPEESEKLSVDVEFFITFNNQSDMIYNQAVLISSQSRDEASKRHLPVNASVSFSKQNQNELTENQIAIIVCIIVILLALSIAFALVAFGLVTLTRRKRKMTMKRKVSSEENRCQVDETSFLELQNKLKGVERQCWRGRRLRKNSEEFIKLQMSDSARKKRTTRDKSNCGCCRPDLRTFICTHPSCLSPNIISADFSPKIDATCSSRGSSTDCGSSIHNLNKNTYNKQIKCYCSVGVDEHEPQLIPEHKFCDARKEIECLESRQVADEMDKIKDSNEVTPAAGCCQSMNKSIRQNYDCRCSDNTTTNPLTTLTTSSDGQLHSFVSYVDSGHASCCYSNASSCGSRSRENTSRSSSVLSDATSWCPSKKEVTPSEKGVANNKVIVVDVGKVEPEDYSCHHLNHRDDKSPTNVRSPRRHQSIYLTSSSPCQSTNLQQIGKNFPFPPTCDEAVENYRIHLDSTTSPLIRNRQLRRDDRHHLHPHHPHHHHHHHRRQRQNQVNNFNDRHLRPDETRTMGSSSEQHIKTTQLFNNNNNNNNNNDIIENSTQHTTNSTTARVKL